VTEKTINADQKAQALKKPSLQAAVTQIEEQLGHYKQFAAQYEEKITTQKAALDEQKAALDKIHQEELAAVRANALADATESTSRVLRENLLDVAKFLCAAANLRRAGDETPEGVAFEAVLYQVYAGNQDAVTSMVKLIEGVEEPIQGLEGETLDFTCKWFFQICTLVLLPNAFLRRRKCEAGIGPTRAQRVTRTTRYR
jgi:ribosomal protein L16 Arg81 hydroxylase